MTIPPMHTLQQRIMRFEDEYLKFERVENPLCERPDLCAFLLLHRLVPSNQDIISATAHDEIYLSVDMDALHEKASDDDLLTLVRCGVRYDSSYDCLAMFV